jgi:hypothetical protein
VRVSAQLDPQAEAIVFAVVDTGIGIAESDQQRIFDEFAQIEHPLQRRFKGTGLGLPLSKGLAELLGGRLWVESEIGQGSSFYAEIPIEYRPGTATAEPLSALWERDANRVPVLVVEDRFEDQLFYERILKDTPFQHLGVRSLADARQALTRIRPAVIVLDILLGSEETWTFLCQLKEGSDTSTIPVYSDGLGAHWGPEDYAGLWLRDPALVAGVLYRDHTRRRDDVTVLVGRRRLN